MKKLILSLLVLLMMMPQPCAAAEEATALRFGTDEAVSAIYASYEMEAGAQTVTVTFADHVKATAQANYVNGKLWISIASASTIDLSGPVGWVTATDAEGRTFAPTLKLASLNFNGEPARCNLTIGAVDAHRSGTALQVAVQAAEAFGGSYLLCAAAYDAAGRQVSLAMQTAALAETAESFSLELKDSAAAACVKVFFLTDGWSPVAAETVRLAD